MLRCTSTSTADNPITNKPPLVAFTATPASCTPRACSDSFIRTPGTLAMPPPGKSGGRLNDFGRVTGRQCLVDVATQRPGDHHVALGNRDIGANPQLRSKTAARRDGFCLPHRRADILLALRIAWIFLIEHHALHNRGAALCVRRGGWRLRARLLLRHPSTEFRFTGRLLGGLALMRPQVGHQLIEPVDIGPLPGNQRAETDNNQQYDCELGETAIGARWSPLPIMIRRLERTPYRRPSRFDTLLVVKVVRLFEAVRGRRGILEQIRRLLIVETFGAAIAPLLLVEIGRIPNFRLRSGCTAKPFELLAPPL